MALAKSGSMTCMACLDNDEAGISLVDLECGEHAICLDCLRQVVTLAINEEANYPPQCGSNACGYIAVDIIDTALSATHCAQDRQLLETFHAKMAEYNVPAAKRTYCANTHCQVVQGHSRYLDPEIMGEDFAVLCPDCSEVTCRQCKGLISEPNHVCQANDRDEVMKEYLATLPEDQRWLWQKCCDCGFWINKIDACNHMTCRCGAEFCLVCGSQWSGLVSCERGCPHYDQPIYDDEGYNQHGFHRDTGLDRDGESWDTSHEHENDQDGYWVDGRWYDFEGFDEDGYDEVGFDAEGYDREGFDEHGYDRDGFDERGYDCDGFDEHGINAAGFDMDGFDENGFDAKGYDRKGFDEDGYDRDGFDENGFDENGYSKRTVHRRLFDDQGYDRDGFDAHGYSREGYDEAGYDRNGYDVGGYDIFGWDEKRQNQRSGGERVPRAGNPKPLFLSAHESRRPGSEAAQGAGDS